MLHLVWLKRDLRLHDHAALQAALHSLQQQGGKLALLYAVEPGVWAQPDSSLRQWQFVRESLRDLQQPLPANAALWLLAEDMPTLLPRLQQALTIPIRLYSHIETGNLFSYRRDQAVQQVCRALDIVWQQLPQNGVRRASRSNPHSRDDWAAHWAAFMEQPQQGTPMLRELPWLACPLPDALSLSALPLQLGFDLTPCPGRQPGGRSAGLALLHSFLSQRGEYYRGSLGSPLSAEHHASRLSPYLAWGCLSVREVLQATRTAHAGYKHQGAGQRWLNSLSAFESRLWWHCHFIQKLEDEPQQEQQPLHPAWAGVREFNASWYSAWANGQTGWPLADACMKYLQHHGWLNFRMRAMLMSLASYPLWLPWQQPARHLARAFTDYEPGIHYPQVQMQSGTTGINPPRMYNPTLQAQKQDPHGVFIRRWLPPLAQVPDSWIHQPWGMSQRLQAQCGVIIGHDYPAPLVDFEHSARLARERIRQLRQQPEYFSHAAGIGQKHGSRKRSPARSGRKKAVSKDQLSLF
ncbi:MAG: deoxyribodipyrimidine photo-lyase [Saccharospirillaceae bacterium]|nr:deoxyribodipyrimidine photo-lyase [Saccharospirillaceae bacterium]